MNNEELKGAQEIKFRAWNPDIGEMDYTLRIWNPDGEGTVNSLFEETRGLIVMQYTGLKDKNNRQIYFDDILKTPHGVGKVAFVKAWARICIDDYSLTAPLLLLSEVIGNVYENPELLEAKNAES